MLELGFNLYEENCNYPGPDFDKNYIKTWEDCSFQGRWGRREVVFWFMYLDLVSFLNSIHNYRQFVYNAVPQDRYK